MKKPVIVPASVYNCFHLAVFINNFDNYWRVAKTVEHLCIDERAHVLFGKMAYANHMSKHEVVLYSGTDAAAAVAAYTAALHAASCYVEHMKEYGYKAEWQTIYRNGNMSVSVGKVCTR